MFVEYPLCVDISCLVLVWWCSFFVPFSSGGGGPDNFFMSPQPRGWGNLVLGEDPMGVSVGVGVRFHFRALSSEPVNGFFTKLA